MMRRSIAHSTRTVMLMCLVCVMAFALPWPAAASDDEAPEPMRWLGWQGGWYISDPANWAGRVAPEPIESRPVDFRSRAQVVVDRDQRFHGGLRMNAHRLSVAWYLRGHSLTLADTVRIGAARSSGFLSEGTLRLGEPGHPATVHFYGSPGEGRFRLTDTAVLHTENVAALTVSDASGNTNSRGEFDLSQSSLVDDALRSEVLRLGRYRGRTAGRGGHGTLRLPASTRTIEVGELLLGVNERRVGDGDASFARGTLDLGGGERVTLHVRDSASWAVGDHASAEITELPERLNLTVGAVDAPASWRVADNNRLEEAERDTVFELTAPAGTLVAHLDELIAGRNTGQAGGAEAMLDLTAMTSRAFEAERVILGVGPGAKGHLLLPSGRVRVGTLHVGAGGRLALGANEDGGLEVTADAEDALQIDADGELRISVADSTSGGWLLRLAGSWEAELSAMLDDGRVTVEGVEADRLTVTHADGRTMLAIQ